MRSSFEHSSSLEIICSIQIAWVGEMIQWIKALAYETRPGHLDSQVDHLDSHIKAGLSSESSHKHSSLRKWEGETMSPETKGPALLAHPERSRACL